MEEVISTTPTATEQTTPETTTETTQPVETQTTEEVVANEPAESTTEGTETTTTEPVKNWEQIAKDNQASFTRVSQELAELKKQIAENKPKLVDEKGKIDPKFEQEKTFEIDNNEFLAYDNLARQLDNETRVQVENLLNEARSLYNPSNKRAYQSKLAEVKNFFRADIVEQIALEKRNAENQMQADFDKKIGEFKQARANEIAQQIETMPDLKALVSAESENYSEPVFGIIKQMFDLTGNVDLELTNNAIKSIKELGVKEYLASQKVDSTKNNASVPTGATVPQVQTGMPTRDELVSNPALYREACSKFGMEKVDDIIMKG